jgi:hypothetical protein
MVTSCCHGNVKSIDCGLNLRFYIRGNNGLCKNLVSNSFLDSNSFQFQTLTFIGNCREPP